MMISLLFWSFAVLAIGDAAGASTCPAGCYCSSSTEGLKINCHPIVGKTKTTDVFHSLPADTFTLDMAKYGLTEIAFGLFRNLSIMEKLDLQNNAIAHIEEGSFALLRNLRVLDLSRNQLEVITTGMFEGLESLERLKLNDNRIQTIEQGAFGHLKKLRKLEMSDNPFICDCNLAWLISWLRSTPDLLSSSSRTKCALPIAMADTVLLDVNPEALLCGSNLANLGGLKQDSFLQKSSVQFDLKPKESQVVFEGDSFLISCRVDVLNLDQSLEWRVRGKPINSLNDTNVSVIENIAVFESTVFVKSLNHDHSGEWTCKLSNDEISRQSINVLVISSNNSICDPTTTKTSKGNYIWSAALRGNILQRECETPKEGLRFAFAYFLCESDGEWAPNVNTSQCGYSNRFTDTLHKFATMNHSFSFSEKTLLSSAKQFLNFTSDLDAFRDPMDIVFYSHAAENYLPYLKQKLRFRQELGHYVMTMIEHTLGINGEIMVQAQARGRACQKLINVANNITMMIPEFQHHTHRIAVESFVIDPVKYDGVTCAWYLVENPIIALGKRRVFHCSDANATTTVNRGTKTVMASVTLPKSIYQEIKQHNAKLRPLRDIIELPLVIAAHTNSTLFPTRSDDMDSAVIGVFYSGPKVGNLSERITVAIRKDFDEDLVEPVWWDDSSESGIGAWKSDFCNLLTIRQSVAWFRCNRIGYYSLRRIRATVHNHPMFKLHHPLIYVGSIIAIVLILASVVIYSLSFPSICMTKELKHALINVWVSMAALFFVFVTGVHQVEDISTCQIVGIFEHYLTLCSFAWIVLTGQTIFSRINELKEEGVNRQLGGASSLLRSRSDRRWKSNDASGSTENTKKVRRRSISKFYLLGWGVSSLIVGVTIATNLANYGLVDKGFCFMKLTAFLAAIILPVALSTALLTGFALSAWCLASSSPLRVGERFEASSMKTDQPLPDTEKTIKSLLLSLWYIFVLFSSTWMCGSLAVIQPLSGHLPYEDLFFAILFTISAISLGVFIFVYFCASRQDVQECWRSPLCNFIHLSNDCISTNVNEMTNLVAMSTLQRHAEVNTNTFGSLQRPEYAEPQFLSEQQGLRPSQAKNFLPKPTDSLGKNSGIHLLQERKDSDVSSDHLSLNNVNHLRRGYVAPVNSAGVSETEYGLSGHYIGTVPSAALNISRPLSFKKTPKTSSPAGGEPVSAFIDEDITLSPLNANAAAIQQFSLRNSAEDTPLNGNEYSQSSTVQMGVPCQLASYIETPPELFPAKNIGNSVRQPPKSGIDLSREYLQESRKTRRKRERHKNLPSVEQVPENESQSASEEQEEDAYSKASATSSNYSSGRSAKKKRHKRPNRRRPRPSTRDDNLAYRNEEQNQSVSPRPNRRYKTVSEEQNYYADEQDFGSLDEFGRECDPEEVRGDQRDLRTESETLEDFDKNDPPSQFVQDLPSRETSV